MTTSANIQEKIMSFLSDQKHHSVQEIKAFLQQCELHDYTEGQFAGSINTLLRNKSIQKIDRGVYTTGIRSENMKKCFVVSPIGESGSEIRINADKVFKFIIKPVCDSCGFEAIRVDQLNDASSITQTVIEFLDSAELVIADMSHHNPNVFYEMGYRARTKKPMIHLKQKGEVIPFDVNTIRTLEYDLTDLENVEEVKARLRKTVESFSYSENTELIDEDSSDSASTASMLPIMYQLVDMMEDLKTEFKNFTTDTIGTVVKSLQPMQPQMSSDTALQMQLMNGFMQNPESFMKLIELSEKFNTRGK